MRPKCLQDIDQYIFPTLELATNTIPERPVQVSEASLYNYKYYFIEYFIEVMKSLSRPHAITRKLKLKFYFFMFIWEFDNYGQRISYKSGNLNTQGKMFPNKN